MNITQQMLKPILISSFLATFALSGATWAQTTIGTMTKDEISAQHDADMKRCESMSGNEKDVCEQEADALRDSNKADAKANKKTAEAQRDATKDKRDAAYDVAKEKCDTMSGDAKDQCIAQAKTQYGK